MNKDAIEVKYEGDIEDVIKYLLEEQEKGNNVYIDYVYEYGVIRIYSNNVNEDTIYRRMYGLTKQEKLDYDEELKNSTNKEEVIKKYRNIGEVYFDKERDFAKKVELKEKGLRGIIDTLNEYKKLNENVYFEFGSTNIRFYSMVLSVKEEFINIMQLPEEDYNILIKD